LIEINPLYSAAYELLGWAIAWARRFEEAVKVLEKGIIVARKQGDLKPMNSMQNLLSELH
jgi:hypothetical protein